MTLLQRKIKAIILLSLFVLITSTIFFWQNINTFIINGLQNGYSILLRDDDMLVHFISVGQGDSIAVDLPDGKVMLIDAGPKNQSMELCNYLDDYVFNGKHNKKIDYFVLTHADEDHIGGAIKVLQNYQVGTLIMPKYYDKTEYYTLQNYVLDNDVNAIEKQDFLCPNTNYEISLFWYDDGDINATSTIIKLTYNEYDFLFAGDIESDTETMLKNDYGSELNCEVLKVAHHGSSDASSLEFLQVVSPNYAVISCGKNNSYGHPTQQTLDNLSSVNAQVYRTDNQGNIVFKVADNLSVLTTEYKIFNVSFDYKICVILIDTILLIDCTFVVFKLQDKKYNK